MRRILLVCFVVALVLAGGTFTFVHMRDVRRAQAAEAAQVAANAEVAKQADDAVAAFRKVIVLTDGIDTLDDDVRERIVMVGQVVFHENVRRLADLSNRLVDDAGRSNTSLVESFLARVESDPDYRDADKLVFRDIFQDLAAAEQTLPASSLQKRIADDNAALDQIQALYEKEIGKAFADIQTRGMGVRREAWDSYLAFVRQKYQRDDILKQYEDALPESDTRGGGVRAKSSRQMYGAELPPKTLLLTFDDGPHPRYTDKILKILKDNNIQAVFFEVGRNVGTVAPDGQIKLAPTAAVSYRILAQGSSIGNHSYSHPVLPKLDPAGYTREIDSTNDLLKYVLKSDPALFRPPYGASNTAILDLAQSDHLKTMIWNIDSMDWADPVASSIAQRVMQGVEKYGRGIILFHDIHSRAIAVLPDLIATLRAQGYHFASWTGTGFATQDATRSKDEQETAAAPAEVVSPYRESWAAVIGIDDYQNWPKLRYAANDAQAVRDVLVQKYNFKPENVFLLLNGDATRKNILSLLGDKLANTDMVKHEDRVFVFYAGHGATRKLPSGRDLGYIIPVDADLSDYEGGAISMTNFQDIAEAIPAKHVLFVMDSCYSGLALTRGGGMAPGTMNYLQQIAGREARQMFTAGEADQQVADGGPNGHSIFTWTLLQALDGRADLNGDGVITATELAAYVSPAVAALSHQTPVFGNLAGSEGGDFIFDLKHQSEFLNSDSAQLNDDGIKMNSELEKLRTENQAEAQQNEELKKELAAAQALLAQTKQQEATRASTPTDRAAALNDEGMRLYREKKYAEAANKFTEASGLNPASALFPNNAGFALFKLGQYDEAVKWYQQAIALDPDRAIAFINLGDAYAKLGHNLQAKQAYEKFLQLAPNSKSAAYAQKAIASLGP
ncbi:MAG TPA: polysaccharide deacetylase family protein [Candidatus Acidoferrales bacterium]|nr:polysaccharide deacetylase family protein [Candidatus Acidoferrales bacterium]